MNIVNLKVENIKKLSAVDITPKDNMVVIGGKNGQGKSSTLDAIWMALGGGKAIPAEPVRDNTGEASVTITTDTGYVITRVIKADRTSKLEIKSADGAKFSSPQVLLDKWCSSLSFDPLEFIHADNKKQVEALKSVAGLNFDSLNADRQKAYDDRTIKNRIISDLQSQLKAASQHLNAPKEEVKISDLIQELEVIQAQVKEFDNIKRDIIQFENRIATCLVHIEQYNFEIAELKERIADEEGIQSQTADDLKTWKTKLAGLTVADPEPVKKQIAEAETINRQVRENKERDFLIEKLNAVEIESEALTEKIAAIDTKKQTILGEANFPVDGLSFDESGVRYKDKPLSQASGAEQLRVSVAMGMAFNPEMKVLLIRDGSLLDEDNLKLLGELAAANNAQVWIERVGSGDEVSVVIEDGKVLEAR